MARRPSAEPLDTELDGLPQAQRWHEWMARIEAVLFATPEPVSRGDLARVIGRDCNIDFLIEDLENALRDRPYEIVRIGTGWQMRTRSRYGLAIRTARGIAEGDRPFTRAETLVLTVIAYLQPVTRSQIARLTGREVGRDIIARLSREGLIARGPRSPEPGAPYSYVTTTGFLTRFGLESLRALPDLEALEDAGLLQRDGGVPDLPISPEDTEEGAGGD